MHLETERMILREFTYGDADALQAIFGDEETMRNTEPVYSLDKTKDFLKTFCIEREPKGAYAAVHKETGQLIGYVLFKPLDYPEIYEIGWIFNRNYWRRGYASEIVAALIEYGFSVMKLHKICAEAIDVEKSVPLMKKLGMTCEGVQRKHTKDNDGIWRDLHWYAILAEDYCIEHRETFSLKE